MPTCSPVCSTAAAAFAGLGRRSLEAGLLLIVGLGLLLRLPRVSPHGAVGLWRSLLLVLVTSINLAAWAVARLVLPMATEPLCLVAACWRCNCSSARFSNFAPGAAWRSLFGQYVPPELVEEMSRDPQRYSMAGRSAELTVLFADVRGFTTLAEQMPPDELAHLMNDYLSAMTDVIRAHRGTLDKYIGDAIVAFWGAPVADPQHARHAVAAGLAMQAALPASISALPRAAGRAAHRHRHQQRHDGRRRHGLAPSARLHGARRRGQSGVTLQELSAHYGAGVIIGEATRQALGDWPCRELDRVTVRGRTAPWPSTNRWPVIELPRVDRRRLAEIFRLAG
jgi:adenylate cyclase